MREGDARVACDARERWCYVKWHDKFRLLQAHAHAVSIEVNEYRTVYDSVTEALAQEDIDDDVRAACERTKHVVIVHCYPNTSVGFCRVVHFELETAIERVYELVRERLSLPTGPVAEEKKR